MSNKEKIVIDINNKLKDKEATLVSVPDNLGYEFLSYYYSKKFRKKTLVIVESDEMYSKVKLTLDSNMPLDEVNEYSKKDMNKEALINIATIKKLANDFQTKTESLNIIDKLFDIAIVFEANHFISNAHAEVMEFVKKISKKRIGITSLTYRSDNVNIRSFFHDLSHAYSIKDAIQNKELLPYKTVDINYTSIENKDKEYEELIKTIVQLTKKIINDNGIKSKLIVYLPSIEACKKMQIILDDTGINNLFISSNMNTNTKRSIENSFTTDTSVKVVINYAYIINRSSFSVASHIIMGRNITSDETLYSLLNNLLLTSNPNTKEVLIYDFFNNMQLFEKIDLTNSYINENKAAADLSKVRKRDYSDRETSAEENSIVDNNIKKVTSQDLKISKSFVNNMSIKIRDDYYTSLGFDNRILESIYLGSTTINGVLVDKFKCSIYRYTKKANKLLDNKPLDKEADFYDFTDMEYIIQTKLDPDSKDVIQRMIDEDISEKQLKILQKFNEEEIIPQDVIEAASSKQQGSSLLAYAFFRAKALQKEIDFSDVTDGKSSYKGKATLDKDGVLSKNVNGVEEMLNLFREKKLYVESKFYYIMLLELVKIIDTNASISESVLLDGEKRHIGNFKYSDPMKKNKDGFIDMFLISIESYIKDLIIQGR